MKPIYNAITFLFLTTIFALPAWADTIPVTGQLDCSASTDECRILGVGVDPIFSGSVSTGDVIDITFAGNMWFQPILDDESLTPWEVSIGGQGTNSGENVGIRIYLSDMNGDPVTGTAGLSLDGFLSGSDGVSFLTLPTFVYGLQIEIGQWDSTDVTRTFTLNSVNVSDRADEGPIITFRVGDETQTTVPEPTSLLLLGTGLGALGLISFRRRKK